MTGEGMDELFDAVQEARQEYEREYKPELEKLYAERVRFSVLSLALFPLCSVGTCTSS